MLKTNPKSHRGQAGPLRNASGKDWPTRGSGLVEEDTNLVLRLRTVFDKLDDDLVDDCFGVALLPHPIMSAVDFARFLSIVLIPTFAAQDSTGVPASILISSIWHEAPYELIDDLANGIRECASRTNDVFRTGKAFPSIEAAFINYAERLAVDPRFQEVIKTKHDPARCLKELRGCQVWAHPKNLVHTIIEYKLQELDAPNRQMHGHFR